MSQLSISKHGPCVRNKGDCDKTYAQAQLALHNVIYPTWSKKCTSNRFGIGDTCTDDEDMLYCPALYPTFCPSDSAFRNNKRTNSRSKGNTAPCVRGTDQCETPYEVVYNENTYGETSKKCTSGLPEEERGDQCHRD